MRFAHAAVTASVLIVGCSSDPKPVVKSPPPPPPVAAPLSPPQQQAVAQAQQETGGKGIHFDEDILKLCPSVRPPLFAYDSASVDSAYREALVALAACMRDGGLKGKGILLVGHADPRGEESYNFHLGDKRAASVRAALHALGADISQMDISSRGEVDATGTEESGWSKDRRVDIKLKGKSGS